MLREKKEAIKASFNKDLRGMHPVNRDLDYRTQMVCISLAYANNLGSCKQAAGTRPQYKTTYRMKCDSMKPNQYS